MNSEQLNPYSVTYERDGEWWVATAPEVSSGFSQGKTLDEARDNLVDAIHELQLARHQLKEAGKL